MSRVVLFAPIFACAFSIARAADPVDAVTPAESGVLTRAPQVIRQMEARFPPEMLEGGAGGTVVMEIDIDAHGRVTDARVVQSAGAAFDSAAMEAVKHFEFSPAEIDGQPASVRLRYSYEFRYRPAPGPEQAVNFSGRLLQRGTRDPIRGATVAVMLPDGPVEAVSNDQGRFEFHGLPAGTFRVVVRAQDYAPYEVEEQIARGRRTEATYYVRRLQYGAYETVVRGERERKEVSQVNLRQEEIRLMPGAQGDALRVVQNLPGVARAPFSTGLLVVRGGKPWDTRVYIDDTLVPQLFHFGGLFATFNSNLLEEIDFQPGNFGAAFGRNIGGIVRGRTRTPSQKGIHGYVDLNLVDVSALVEAPLDGAWSIAASARRSHVDAMLPLALDVFAPEADDVLNFTVAPRYYDYQLRLERRSGAGRDRLSVSFFGSNDEIALVLSNPVYDPEGRADFETLLAYNRLAFNWERDAGEGVRSRTHLSLGLDRYRFGAGGDLFSRTDVYPFEARQGFTFRLADGRLDLSVGADVFVLPYRAQAQVPPRFKLNQIPDPFLSRRLISEDGVSSISEPAVYAEAIWLPHPRVKIVPGFRFDYDATMDALWFDPRLAAFFRVGDELVLKGGVGLFHQPPDYRQGQLSPTFGNPDLLPEGAWHYSIGAEHRITDALGVDVQLYYKRLFHQAVSTLAPPADSTASADAVDVRFQSTGRRWSYGAEFLVRHQLTQNFFGWLAYSISRTERLSPLGTGAIELTPLDQPHNLVGVLSYKLPFDVVLGARIRYASGALNTPYVGAIYDANGNYYFPIPGERFSRRLPAFFQLDVRVDRRWVYENWMLSAYVDVLNVTNRSNVEGVSYNFDYTQQRYLSGLPIIPALGARGEF